MTRARIPLLFCFASLIALAPGASAQPAPPGASAAPAGAWLTEDRAVVVAFEPCGAEGETVCGVIRALPGGETDASLLAYADDLCGLTLLWGLSYSAEENRWTGGALLDPETEAVYDAQLWLENAVMKVLVYADSPALGSVLEWTSTPLTTFGCDGPAGAKTGGGDDQR